MFIKGETIIIAPRNSRAKNRVREHGNKFKFLDSQNQAVLVECLCSQHSSDKWMGWFDQFEASWSK